MIKNMKKRAFTAILLAGMAMTIAPLNASAAAGVTTGRLFGSDRIATAIAVAGAGWKTADTAVLAPASDANLVDALAAAPLAGQKAPVLLTENNSLNFATKTELVSLSVKKVYVVGALSQTVVDQVNAISGVSTVVLKGNDRIGTAAAISAKLSAPAGSFVVGYGALADALSIASYAAANNYSILVANPDGTLPAAESSYLGAKVYIIGGPSLVQDLPGAVRLFGADRFATNQAVLNALTYNYANTYLANGTDPHLVDSLVASSLAALSGAPIVLCDSTSVPNVKVNLPANAAVTALGGGTVVPDTIVAKFADANVTVPTAPAETLTISNLTVTGQTGGTGTQSSPALVSVNSALDISATIKGTGELNPANTKVTYLVSTSSNITAKNNGQTLTPTTLNTPIIIGNDSYNASYSVPADANGTAEISFTSAVSSQQLFNIVAQAATSAGSTPVRSNEVSAKWTAPANVSKDPHTITVTGVDMYGNPLANQTVYLQPAGLDGIWLTQVNGQTVTSVVNMGTDSNGSAQTVNTPVPLFVYSAQTGNQIPAYTTVSSQCITAYNLTTAPVIALRTGNDGTVSITLQSQNVVYPSLNPTDPTAARDYYADPGSASASGDIVFTSGQTKTSTNVLGTIHFSW